ncbi:MAG: CHAP domain-containing protein [Pontixanthobacter sp.]
MMGSTPVVAESAASFGDSRGRASGSELPAYLQCVPYAREQTGIQIYGDAHTWWDQADGKFARGNRPKVGAVMAFQPYRNMQLGHVAAVSKVIDSRTVLLRHSNWSPINGRRGQIENDVRAIDVSPGNDWSMVRVWYDPIQDLGTTPWPVQGFIYPDKARSFAQPQRVAQAPRVAQAAALAPRIAPSSAPAPRPSSQQFANAFADLGAKPMPQPQRTQSQPAVLSRASTNPASAIRNRPSNDFSDVLAKYDK